MSETSPTLGERATAIVAYLSLFTCLPIVFWPGLYTGSAFVARHANFARGWYLGLLFSLALSVVLTVASFGVGALSVPLPLMFLIPGVFGAGAAALGFGPPAALVTALTWAWTLLRIASRRD